MNWVGFLCTDLYSKEGEVVIIPLYVPAISW